jgi:hypothetical protein
VYIHRLRRRHALRQDEHIVAAAEEGGEPRDQGERDDHAVAIRHEIHVQTAGGVQDDVRRASNLWKILRNDLQPVVPPPIVSGRLREWLEGVVERTAGDCFGARLRIAGRQRAQLDRRVGSKTFSGDQCETNQKAGGEETTHGFWRSILARQQPVG